MKSEEANYLKKIQNNDCKKIKNCENKVEKIQESINKDIEDLRNKCTETSNTITGLKYSLRNQ